MSVNKLSNISNVSVQQRVELFEVFGYETRNKYEVLGPNQESLYYIAENQKTILGFFLRQYLGHWRTFELNVFDSQRNQIARAIHPFKFIFQEMRVTLSSSNKEIGYSKKRFAIFSKKFTIYLENGKTLEISSPIWRIWTFNITKNGELVASIKKRWSGTIKEVMTDADNFSVEFHDPSFTAEEKFLLITVAVLIDLSYFERKNNNKR